MIKNSILRFIRSASETGNVLCDKLENITSEFLIQAVSECGWDPMDVNNSDGYTLLDSNNIEVQFSNPIDILPDNRLCFMIDNECTSATDYYLNDYEYGYWFGSAVMYSNFDLESLKPRSLTQGYQSKEDIQIKKINSPIRSVYSKFTIPISDSKSVNIYHMGLDMGVSGDPSYIIIDKNDLPDIVKKCNEIYPYEDYLIDRIVEVILYYTCNQIKDNNTSELKDQIISGLKVALNIKGKNILKHYFGI